MTKQIFIEGIVSAHSYDLQSTDDDSTLWKYEKI